MVEEVARMASQDEIDGSLISTAGNARTWNPEFLSRAVTLVGNVYKHLQKRVLALGSPSKRQEIGVNVDAAMPPTYRACSLCRGRFRSVKYGPQISMKKRTEADFVRQDIATRRSTQNAQTKRKYNPLKSENRFRKVFSRTVITAPASISFFEKRYDEFDKFIKELNKLCRSGRILIELKNVSTVKSAALLVLYANIEQLQKLHNDKHIIKTTCTSSKEVAVILRTYGFWNLTGESRSRPLRAYPDSLEICTMTYEAHLQKDKSELRKLLKYAQASVLKAGMHEGKVLAYNAITESISNVWQHAYDDDFHASPVPLPLRNWWFIAQRIDDQFFIAVYDMGAGIPATISTKPWAAALIETISKWVDLKGYKVLVSPDAKSIKAAVDYGRSRFKLDNRGKGLTEAKDFVQRNPHGSMLIFSGLGHYEYKTKDDQETLETLGSQFRGTLIQWNLMLETNDET
ncbi:hypothetical protein [Pseudomonas kilonensis]|uniref:hypothetical protein n=1 Tax=Pseudomonas kilonensis TaxID=132476 RepID=UPI003397363C